MRPRGERRGIGRCVAPLESLDVSSWDTFVESVRVPTATAWRSVQLMEPQSLVEESPCCFERV